MLFAVLNSYKKKKQCNANSTKKVVIPWFIKGIRQKLNAPYTSLSNRVPIGKIGFLTIFADCEVGNNVILIDIESYDSVSIDEWHSMFNTLGFTQFVDLTKNIPEKDGYWYGVWEQSETALHGMNHSRFAVNRRALLKILDMTEAQIELLMGKAYHERLH